MRAAGLTVREVVALIRDEASNWRGEASDRRRRSDWRRRDVAATVLCIYQCLDRAETLEEIAREILIADKNRRLYGKYGTEER